jgi:putative transposase
MPRESRWVLPGIPLHIVQRGVNRNPCFFAVSDYETYLDFMAMAAQRFSCAVHAYCLMTNHVHRSSNEKNRVCP